MTTTLARLSGTWPLDDAAEILNTAGHRVNWRHLHVQFREAGWIEGRWAAREITEKGWPYLDQDGELLVITGAGIAEVHRRLGGVAPIRIHCSVIRADELEVSR